MTHPRAGIASSMRLPGVAAAVGLLLALLPASSAAGGVQRASEHTYLPQRRQVSVQTYRDTFPLELLEPMKEESPALHEWAAGRHFWLPKGQTPRTVFEEAVERAASLVLMDRFDGAEWWLDITNVDETTPFHTDYDRALYEEAGYMTHPEIHAIFFVESVGGPEVILSQYSPDDGRNFYPFAPEDAHLNSPRENNLVFFQGDFLHGAYVHRPIRDVLKGRKRVALHISWWPYRPSTKYVHDLPKQGSLGKGVTTMTKRELRAYREEVDNLRSVNKRTGLSQSLRTLTQTATRDVSPKTTLHTNPLEIEYPNGEKLTVRVPKHLRQGALYHLAIMAPGQQRSPLYAPRKLKKYIKKQKRALGLLPPKDKGKKDKGNKDEL